MKKIDKIRWYEISFNHASKGRIFAFVIDVGHWYFHLEMQIHKIHLRILLANHEYELVE